MHGIGKAYESTLDTLVESQEPSIPFYSTVTGDLKRGKRALGAAYWRMNLESPVLFNSAVSACLKGVKNDCLFIEIGPQ